MTRGYRILTAAINSSETVSAPPPEAINVESDFIVILAALLCALICVVGLIAIARCAWLRRGNDGAGGGNAAGRRSSSQPSANKGLKKKFVEAIPKYTYDGNLAGDCPICLAEYVAGDEIRVLPQCGHRFHVGCIDLWLGSHSSCPSCRQILVVTRCKKCGEFPMVSPGTTCEVTPGAEEAKGRRPDCSASSSEYLP